MELVKYPNKILSTPSKPAEIGKELWEKIVGMSEAIVELPKKEGRGLAGLAAPQMGINERFFWCLDEWMVNPEITWTPNAPLKEHREGCFSLPNGRLYRTQRHYSLRVKYQDLKGEWVEKRLNGYKAQVFQHEFDHIEGRLCCNHEGNETLEEIIK